MTEVLSQPRTLRDFFDQRAIVSIKRRSPSVPWTFADGIEYPLYEMRVTFDDWLSRLIGSIKKTEDFLAPAAVSLCQLLRPADLERLEQEIPANLWPDALPDEPEGEQTHGGEWYFTCGLHHKIREAEGWDEVKDQVVQIRRPPELLLGAAPHLRSRGFIETTSEICLNLVEQFQEIGVIGASPEMLVTYSRVAEIAAYARRFPNRLPNVLVTGDAGVGKEKIAEAIHELSGREGHFEKLNCAAIPSDLLESELFGHVEGSFTGARTDKVGLLERCRGGTVQLDEIDKMKGNQLPTLLRVLEEKEYRRVGESAARQADVFFIASTNKDLEAVDGFPTDLYQRLREMEVVVPSLADRAGDTPLLMNHFLEDLGETQLDNCRLPLAMWCSEQVSAANLSVRQLRNVVREQVAHWLDPSAETEDRHLSALRSAVEEAVEQGIPRPVPLEHVAPRVGWKKKQGYQPQTLLAAPWREHVDRLRKDRQIKPGQR